MWGESEDRGERREGANLEAISARSHHGVRELTIRKRVKPEPRCITAGAA